MLDAEGYLSLTGRLKEIINRGGEKIAPREVDDVLLDHPAVAQVVTFAMPHDKLGEEVAAAVVLREGQSCERARTCAASPPSAWPISRCRGRSCSCRRSRKALRASCSASASRSDWGCRRDRAPSDRLSFVILVLGTRTHEFVCDRSARPNELVDGRAKHDHDERVESKGRAR